MSAIITGVEKDGLAYKNGIRPGDQLISINGRGIFDVLDYRFFIVDTRLEMLLCDSAGANRAVTIIKEEYDDPGLCFETYLMDKKHACKNKCIFCFIDQLPEGLRESLYFKDDDERLSFLMGNYITLTNLGERETERIISMHLSPVNISVHTTNPLLRVKMMGNKNAGSSLGMLTKLAKAGTAMNCQLVLCSGINDGSELDRTLRDLGALFPSVQSIAVVPVGLTKYREGLFPLVPYDSAGAKDVVKRIEAFGEEFFIKNGTRLVYPADEFYLKAGRLVPAAAFYEDFAQLENGVGMMALFEQQFEQASKSQKRKKLRKFHKISIASGMAASEFINRLAIRAMGNIAGLECKVFPVNNRFFGENVNVSGLVTGRDMIAQLKSKVDSDELLLPASMLRSERDMFLDDLTIEDVERALNIRVTPVETDGSEFYRALTGESDD